MHKQKRVAAINDISCIGKCSLTVALPVLSAAGLETCPLPTALLSTHTGDFKGYTFMDLTSQLGPIAEHWKSFNAEFDAIYSGYLGSKEQLGFTADFIDNFKKDTLVLTDPVMADHGKLYAGFDGAFVCGMARLCKKADIIVPNITEACFLTETPYLGEVQKEEDISELLKKLVELSGGAVVLTGVSFDGENIGAACYNKEKIGFVFSKRLDVAYHGTGDVFASSLLAALMQGFAVEKATEIAVNFVCKCIEQTISDVGRSYYGVNFEPQIKNLLKMLEK